MSTGNTFVQNNGLTIEEGRVYRTCVNELARVDVIDLEKNDLRLFNISMAGNSHHRIDSAIKDNKFTEVIR